MSVALWQVEVLRKTFFFPLELPISVPDLWQQVVGTPPSDRNEKVAAKTVTDVGPWMDQKLSIISQPGRIDIVLEVERPGPDAMQGSLYSDFIDGFQRLDIPLSLSESVIRVAFGAVLQLPGKSHEDCYLALGSLLPHIKIDPSSKEFFYRINNQRVSSVVTGTPLNCISAWAVVRKMFIKIPENVTLDFYFTNLELDISTDVQTALPTGFNSSALFDEMIGTGESISQNGPSP